MQGHLPGGITYKLYCSKLWNEFGNDTSFKYSDPASGHVENASEPNYNFNYSFGTGVECTYRTGPSCVGSEVCAFEMSNITNAHVSDCSAEVPGSEDYGGRLCCEIREICYNGIDDDDDGYTDCADTECIGPTIANHPEHQYRPHTRTMRAEDMRPRPRQPHRRKLPKHHVLRQQPRRLYGLDREPHVLRIRTVRRPFESNQWVYAARKAWYQNLMVPGFAEILKNVV